MIDLEKFGGDEIPARWLENPEKDFSKSISFRFLRKTVEMAKNILIHEKLDISVRWGHIGSSNAISYRFALFKNHISQKIHENHFGKPIFRSGNMPIL